MTTLLAERLINESLAEGQTQFVDDMDAMKFSGGDFRVESDDETGGGTVVWQHSGGDLVYRMTGRALLREVFPSRSIRLIPHQETTRGGVLEALGSHDFTGSLSAPPFLALPATGRTLDDYLLEAWDAATALAVDVEEATVDLDITTTLQRARSQAGLPVQDLAAMFGVKRRHLYNLMSGEATCDAARERRIGRVAELVARLSEQSNGNSKSVRSAILARIDGDSVYDAAVSDDEDRLALATDRALEAIGGPIRPDRLAPFQRASSAEAAAVREFLRSTRDDTHGPSVS